MVAKNLTHEQKAIRNKINSAIMERLTEEPDMFIDYD